MADPVVEVSVVVDTNVFDHGDYSHKHLKKLAKRLTAKGHCLVVPEVAVWEWAEHARGALDVFRSQASQASKRVDPLLRSTIEIPPLPGVEEFARTISKAVAEAGAEVVEPDPDDALEAIRQQILQIEHGTKKERIKTGAADALLAATVRRVADKATGVILVSRDKLLAELAEDPPRVRVVEDQRALWRLLLTVAPAEADVVERFEAYVLESVREELLDGRDPLPSGRPWYDQHVADVLDLHDEAEVYEVTVLGVSAVTAAEAQVVGDDDERFISAELRFVGTVGVFSWRFGGEDEDLIHEYGEAEVEIVVGATGDLDEEFTPLSFELEGPAHLFAPEEYWEAKAPSLPDTTV